MMTHRFFSKKSSRPCYGDNCNSKNSVFKALDLIQEKIILDPYASHFPVMAYTFSSGLIPNSSHLGGPYAKEMGGREFREVARPNFSSNSRHPSYSYSNNSNCCCNCCICCNYSFGTGYVQVQPFLEVIFRKTMHIHGILP